MTARPHPTPARLAVAIVSVLLGLLCLGLWRVVSGAERLPYADSATPPSAVRVTEGKTYSLAVSGGARALRARGVRQSSSGVLDPNCMWTVGNTDTQSLTLTAEAGDTKAVDTFAHFQAPVSGRLHISCAGWGTVFVPDSDDRAPDVSLWYLLASGLLLSLGLPLSLSVARAAAASRADRRSDDELEPNAFLHDLSGPELPAHER